MLNSTSSSDTSTEQSSDYKIVRLEKQIEWHSKKARDNKKRFRMYEIIVMFAGAVIPIVNVIGLEPTTRVISSILGGLIAIVT